MSIFPFAQIDDDLNEKVLTYCGMAIAAIATYALVGILWPNKVRALYALLPNGIAILLGRPSGRIMVRIGQFMAVGVMYYIAAICLRFKDFTGDDAARLAVITIVMWIWLKVFGEPDPHERPFG